MADPAARTAPAEPPETLAAGPVELRRWRDEDVDDLYAAIDASREHLAPWMPWAADQDREDTAEFLAGSRTGWESGERYQYALLADGELAGSCGLMRRIGPGGLEIGYWLCSDATGRGLMTTAVRALIAEVFVLPGITHVEVRHDEANTASGAVPRRLGFTQVARLAVSDGALSPARTGIDIVWRLDRQDAGERR